MTDPGRPADGARRLSGRTAVVTGASRGVGLAVCAALEEAGASVVGVSRSGSPIGMSVVADLTDPAEVTLMADEVHSRAGHPTILVNAAGMFGPISTVAASDPAHWTATLMINTVAPYLTCRAFLPGMIDHGWGRVINISSAASLDAPGPLNGAYTTSKGALNQFTRGLAAELAGTGVTANLLHPGDIKTEMWRDITDQAEALGPAAEGLLRWSRWVEATGGDPVHRAGAAVLDIIAGDDNGRFCWIEDPVKAPLPSW